MHGLHQWRNEAKGQTSLSTLSLPGINETIETKKHFTDSPIQLPGIKELSDILQDPSPTSTPHLLALKKDLGLPPFSPTEVQILKKMRSSPTPGQDKSHS